MSESGLVAVRGCENLEAAEFDAEFAEDLALSGLFGARCYRKGTWHFADDKPGEPPATVKTDAMFFYNHAFWAPLLLGVYEGYPCVRSADLITYAPDGPRDFAAELGRRTGKPVSHARRIPGAGRHDFEFLSAEDRRLAGEARSPFMVEDITSTLSTPAAMRRLMAGAQAEVHGVSVDEAHSWDVHVLSILLRGFINDTYRRGLVFHTLAERHIPRDAGEFSQLFGFEPTYSDPWPPGRNKFQKKH